VKEEPVVIYTLYTETLKIVPAYQKPLSVEVPTSKVEVVEVIIA